LKVFPGTETLDTSGVYKIAKYKTKPKRFDDNDQCCSATGYAVAPLLGFLDRIQVSGEMGLIKPEVHSGKSAAVGTA
jgi:hypothetical protein